MAKSTSRTQNGNGVTARKAHSMSQAERMIKNSHVNINERGLPAVIKVLTETEADPSRIIILSYPYIKMFCSGDDLTLLPEKVEDIDFSNPAETLGEIYALQKSLQVINKLLLVKKRKLYSQYLENNVSDQDYYEGLKALIGEIQSILAALYRAYSRCSQVVSEERRQRLRKTGFSVKMSELVGLVAPEEDNSDNSDFSVAAILKKLKR